MFKHVQVFEQAIAEASQATPAPTSGPDFAPEDRRKPVRHTRRSMVPFIRGPVPLRWLTTASALSRGAARLSVAIWYRLGVTGQNVDLTVPQDTQYLVRIDRQLRKDCGLQRWHVSDGVRDLSNAGLVRVVKGGRGRCPVVEVNVYGDPSR